VPHLRLNDGNRAFAALLEGLTDESGRAQKIVSVDARDLGLSADDPALPKQRPFAAIVGCSDARVPIELIFNEGPNDLFVIRVAGNGLGTEVLGSLKYAVDHLSGSLKLIVVLGHSGCGALTAAVDVFLNPENYLLLTTMHSLRNILDGLLVVVQASAKKIQEAFGPDVSRRPGYRQTLIEASMSPVPRSLPIHYSRNSGAVILQACKSYTASTCSRPGRYGHRMWEEQRKLD
jgi:carbonic anhydrase